MKRDAQDHGLLLRLLQQVSTTGDFTLSSGKKSDWYLDCREVTATHCGLRWVAGEILEMKEKVDFNVLGGPASAAWLRGWTPFGSFHAWLGVLAALLFATAGFLGHRLATGRVTGDRGAFATRHGLTGTLALLAGAVAAAAGMVLLP